LKNTSGFPSTQLDAATEKIEVSIIATAHRPKNWETVFKSIVTNLNFEVVFVGPNALPKNVNLPENFRFIKSKVKPTQCVEMAIRASRGKFLLLIADDLVFETQFAVDELVDSWYQLKNPYSISSCKYKLHGISQSETDLRYFAGDLSTPLLPIGALMLKSSVVEVGGIDLGFTGVFYDIDLVMRLYEKGGELHVTGAFVDEKIGLKRGSTLCGDYWKSDREYLNSLWTQNGKVVGNRLRQVSKFKDTSIESKTQGPRGHWAGRTSFTDYINDLDFWTKKFIDKIVVTKNGQLIIKLMRLKEIRSMYRRIRIKAETK
jgi:hypothetical protein